MCSYNLINDVHACQDPDTLTGVLRKQWDFRGFVVSDWFVAVRSTVQSATAGLDLEMPTGEFFGKPLKKAVATGQVRMATLNKMVLDILTPMFRLGLFAQAPAEGPHLQTRNVSTAADIQPTLTLAEDGTVLLKNAGNVLPLYPTRQDNRCDRPTMGASRKQKGPYGGREQGVPHVPSLWIRTCRCARFCHSARWPPKYATTPCCLQRWQRCRFGGGGSRSPPRSPSSLPTTQKARRRTSRA